LKKIILIILLITFSIKVKSQSVDYRILKSINQNEHPTWDITMRTTSNSIFPVMLASPISLIGVGYIQNNQPVLRDGFKTAISIGLNAALTSGLKLAVNRKRPFVKYPHDISQRTHAGKYSFPSGHTSNAFAAATALTLSSKKWYVAVPSYAYACLVGYSRMRLGVHFPSDVLGGMVIGIGTSLLVFQADKWLQTQNIIR